MWRKEKDEKDFAYLLAQSLLPKFRMSITKDKTKKQPIVHHVLLLYLDYVAALR